MTKFKISFFETEPWETDYLKAKLKGFDMFFFPDKLDSGLIKKNSKVNIISSFIYSKLDKFILENLPSLKFIATRSTGFDHIDLEACGAKKVLVANVPSYGENTVAEHTFALLLALSRKICLSWEKARQGNFSLDNLRGFDLKNKVLGVIGTGNIGRHVIRIAKGFEMEVIAFDVRRDLKLSSQLGFKYVTLNNLFKNSDIVTLHLPDNQATHHLVNLKTLPLIKKGCYLINTARGGLCQTTALLQGLEKGVFAGLGLDVLEEECFIKEERELLSAAFKKTCDLKTALENHILINQPKVVITSHNAFNSKEALQRILDTTILNIMAFAKNKPINLVW